MLVEHSEAVLALLAAAPNGPPLNVYTDEVLDDIDIESHPYVRVYFDGSYPDINFQGVAHSFSLGVTIHSVSGNAVGTMMVADRVAAALLNKQPTVTGRKSHKIRWDSSTPPQSDESPGQPVFHQVDVYVLRSVPA